uniref:Uncharacterized protein n=1 Tax=Romanomermis culicivorax TaxID=13658 RepID=A0A915L827_ROMCU
MAGFVICGLAKTSILWVEPRQIYEQNGLRIFVHGMLNLDIDPHDMVDLIEQDDDSHEENGVDDGSDLMDLDNQIDDNSDEKLTAEEDED